MSSVNLFPHQIKVLEDTANLTRVAYYLDMGLGKTFVGSEKMRRLGATVNLVICQKSKVVDWIEHFEEHYDVFVYDMTNKKDFESFFRHKDFCSPKVGVINYELAWRRPELLKLQHFSLMLDESSLIQNKSAKQTKFILKLHPENVILLSGTPTSGKYENLWTQAHLLGWDISDRLYQSQYVNWTNLNIGWGQQARTIEVVDKANPYKNVERLKSKLREHGAVFMKTEECFDLPEQTFIEVNVPKSKEYSKFMKNSLIMIDDTELIGDTTLTKHLYSRQLCGQYSKLKFEAFRDLIESTNDRLIVFYNFKKEVEILTDIAVEYERPVSVINGEVKELTNYETEDNSITFVQYQAGAMGLNLQKANKIIYFTLTERSELFEQSKKRIHRIGQNKPCYYYILMCENTIEEHIYQALKERKDYTDNLFVSDNYES